MNKILCPSGRTARNGKMKRLVERVTVDQKLTNAKEFRVDVSKPREPHLSECPTLVQSTEYKRKRRNDKNTRAMQRTTPCTSLSD